METFHPASPNVNNIDDNGTIIKVWKLTPVQYY